MKNITLATLLLAFSFPSFAQNYNDGALKVSLSDNSPITVSVDGRYFQKHGTSMTVGDLPPGRHRLKIFLYRPDGYPNQIYKGKIITYPRAITYFVLDPANGFTNVSTEPMDNQPAPANPGNEPNYNNGYNNNGNDNQGYNDNMGNDRNNSGYNNQDNYNQNNSTPVDNAPAASPVGSFTEEQMSKLKAKVNSKITDTDKMKAIQDALKMQTITTDQVSTMLDWLNFEESKLQLAKWAYNITLDQENYYNLENKFNYAETRDELEKFINDHKPR